MSIRGGSHHLPLEKESIIGITYSLSVIYKLSVECELSFSSCSVSVDSVRVVISRRRLGLSFDAPALPV